MKLFCEKGHSWKTGRKTTKKTGTIIMTPNCPMCMRIGVPYKPLSAIRREIGIGEFAVCSKYQFYNADGSGGKIPIKNHGY